MNFKIASALLALAASTSACTTMGTNVSGSFRCDGPNGVCAPSTVIDDSAIARIEETSSTDLLSPAGPFEIDDGIAAPVHSVQIAAAQRPSVASYQLSVVLPGYTGLDGTVYERRVVQTEAALPGRGDTMEALAMRRSGPLRSQGLLAAAESAPPFLAVAPGAIDHGPSRPAPQIAIAGGRPNPIEAIENQVNERLAATQEKPRTRAASFDGTVE